MSPNRRGWASANWPAYYRWSAARPPRDLLLRTFDQLAWEGNVRRKRLAVELGCGAGTDSLELLRRGWNVLAVDQRSEALEFLSRRVPPRLSGSLALLATSMEDLDLPKADLIYASYSLPFCSRAGFPRIWKNIRRALVPGGHFAGQLFGDRDEWVGERPLLFHTLGQARRLTQGYRVDLFRETEDESISYSGRKHWHFFDLILEKPSSGRPVAVGSAA